MNVTEKRQIEKVVEFLKSAAEQEQDAQQRSALVNVSCTLELALDDHQEDAMHPHVYLKIVKAPTLLDQAIGECCTTECTHVRNGSCPFWKPDDKRRCPQIADYLYDDE